MGGGGGGEGGERERELPEGILSSALCASTLCSFLGQSAEEQRREEGGTGSRT